MKRSIARRPPLAAALGLVSVLALGCGSSPARETPTEATTATTAVLEPVRPGVRAEGASPEEAAELPIGRSEIIYPSSDAQELNRVALRAHESGDYVASLAGFQAAHEAAPGYPIALYNAACAMTRLGQLEEAAALLWTLLHEDLPAFATRYAADEDLAPLRDSPHARSLDAAITRLRVRYEEALRRGVPASTYQRRAGLGVGGAAPRLPLTTLRVGVYDHQTRRFVPAAPEDSRAACGIVDAANEVVLVVRGHHVGGTCGITFPIVEGVSGFGLSGDGTPLFDHTRIPGADGSLLESVAVRVDATAEQVALTYLGVGLAPSETASFTIGVGAPAPRAAPDITRAATLLFQGNGAGHHFPSAPPGGLRIRGTRLERGEGAPIALSTGHREPTAISSPDGRHLVVLTFAGRCVDGAESPMRHVVDLVDLEAGTVTALAAGRGASVVEARFAPDGTLFMQIDQIVSRYAPGSTTATRDVPAGIYLGSPISLPGTPPLCDC